MDTRLALPAAAAWVAAIILVAEPSALVTTAVCAWGITLAALAWAIVGRRPLLVTVTVVTAAVALVATSAATQAPALRPDALTAAAQSGESVALQVVTTGATGTGQFPATVTSLPGSAAPVLIFDADPDTPVGIGWELSVTATVVATEVHDDVAYLLFASAPAEVTHPAAGYLGWANALRSQFADAAGMLPGDGAALLPGLAIGDTTAVDDSLDNAMKGSSLSHLTAVSGANCAIVVGLILLCGAAIGLPRLWRVLASVAVLAAFVLLVTPEPSVLRASVMATLVLIAYAAGRPIQGLPVLACAVLGLLVTDPWLARNYGFVLSVLATGALLLMASPLAQRLARVMPLWLAAIIAVPLAAQLACQPVLVLLEPSVPAFGVIANILAAPAAPIATIVGLASCVLVPVAPAMAQMGIWVAWLPASFIGATARFFSDLPLARVPWPGSVTGALCLAVITGLLIAVSLVPLSRRAQRWCAWAAAILIAAVVGVLSGSHLATQVGRPADWTFAACDIGQGDAVLVRSTTVTALIDTGPDPAALTSCLDDLGVHHIDLLVLTHFDLDHVGGVEAVTGRVTAVWTGPPGEKADSDLLNRLQGSGARVRLAQAGDSGVLGELRWDVLWPPARLGYLVPGNETSVALHLYPTASCSRGCLSAMFLGDLGEHEQTRMLSLNPHRGQVDVVKVGHHGSADQSAALYRSLAARLGIISVGADNGYGHPAPRILSILSAAGTTPLRTDTGGLILLASDRGGTTTVWSERPTVTGDD